MNVDDICFSFIWNRNGNICQIKFLDFPDMILIEETTREEAICSAQKSLALEILDYESNNRELPVPNERELLLKINNFIICINLHVRPGSRL